jgi:uncharacterized SAM-binding protein YcdF (DUF218 family)
MPDISHAKGLAKILWDYLSLNEQPQKSDIILALGSHDTRVAERAADLFLQGYAPIIVFSGGIGRLTGSFPKPEAEVFADVAMAKGVPKEKIIIENKSTNTGENIDFSFRLLREKNIKVDTLILVTKPYMERRAYATLMKHVSGKTVITTSPQITLDDAPYDGFDMEEVINIIVGDMQRIKIYPEKGFQIYQEIPEPVWKAYEELIALGFTKQLAMI